jgi:hypothetical protein
MTVRVGELVPPEFWTMSDAEQIHALAVAIVRAENYRAVRTLLVDSLSDLRSGQPERPRLAALRRACTGLRGSRPSVKRWE